MSAESSQDRSAQEEAPGASVRTPTSPRRFLKTPKPLSRGDQEHQCPDLRRSKRKTRAISIKKPTVKEQLAAAEQTRASCCEEVQAKREQIDQLHKQQAAVDQQAKEFQAHQVRA